MVGKGGTLTSLFSCVVAVLLLPLQTQILCTISNQNYFQILLANCILLLPKLLRSILQRALSILLFMLRPIAITQ
jgi:hypothetical protein